MYQALQHALLKGLAFVGVVTDLEPYDQVSVTAADLVNFKFYAQHAAAAYINHLAEPGDLIQCHDGQCDDMKAKVLQPIYPGKKGLTSKGILTNIGAYISLDDVRREIVFSVRGSHNLRNFVTDGRVLKRRSKYAPCTWCKVHTGFHNAWNDIAPIVEEVIGKAKEAHPDYKIIATGHSLGGAVAILGGSYLRHMGLNVDIYSYGAPRVGNDYFAKFVSQQGGGGNFRITHAKDPVPRMPRLFIGYRHISPEYWFPFQGCTIDDVKVCVGIANATCNGGQRGYRIRDHSQYFGQIPGPDDKLLESDKEIIGANMDKDIDELSDEM